MWWVGPNILECAIAIWMCVFLTSFCFVCFLRSQEDSKWINAEMAYNGRSLYFIFLFWVIHMFWDCNTNRVTVATGFHRFRQNYNCGEKLFKLFFLIVLFCLLIVDVVSISGLQTSGHRTLTMHLKYMCIYV